MEHGGCRVCKYDINPKYLLLTYCTCFFWEGHMLIILLILIDYFFCSTSYFLYAPFKMHFLNKINYSNC